MAVETDDTFQLGPLGDLDTYCVSGPILARAITEFSAGLKIGKATYDEREHAFWLVLEDFSGGVGYKKLEMREQLGTCWDNIDGVDIRHEKRVVLPPDIDTLAGSPAAYDYGCVGPVGRMPYILSAIGGASGHLYLGIGDEIYQMDSARTALTYKGTIANCSRINSIVEHCEPGGTPYLWAAGTDASGTTYMFRSSDGSAWAIAPDSPWLGAKKCIEDVIVYNKGGGVDVLLGATPIGKIVMSTDGVDWSDDNATEPVTYYDSGYGAVTFLGVATGHWGGPAVYFINAGKLYALDVDNQTAHPINLGSALRLVTGCIHQDSVVVTDAFCVYQYLAGGIETVRQVGPRVKDGLPSCMASGCFTCIFSDGEFLYGVWSLTTAGTSQIMVHTGTGWTPLGPQVATFTSFVGFMERLPVLFTATQTRRLWMMGSAAYNSITGAGGRLYTVPAHGRGPLLGTDEFSNGPLSFVSGWIDGGFSDLEGILLKIKIDGYGLTSDETVKVEYRLNNVEAGWTELGTFVATSSEIWFDANHIGVKFYTVQFQITLNRDSTDNTLSPDLRALVLLYDKKPDLRTAWTVRIDVNRMVEQPTVYKIDTVNCTLAIIWAKLKALYDEKQLLHFIVPTVETTGIKIHIADLPATFDNFRTEAKGRGYVEIQLIQPIKT